MERAARIMTRNLQTALSKQEYVTYGRVKPPHRYKWEGGMTALLSELSRLPGLIIEVGKARSGRTSVRFSKEPDAPDWLPPVGGWDPPDLDLKTGEWTRYRP